MSETPSTSYSVNQPNSSESEQSSPPRHLNVTEPVVAKRICFYKSGDPQFNGIKMVVNNRSYKTFDALLDSLSKRVPLPFGVRNISTPKGRHSITNLEDLEDGKSYICSHQRKMKPINLEQASRKPLPWQISRPVSARRRAVQLARGNEDGYGHREIRITTPKKMLVFKNGDIRLRRTIVLGKKNTQTFEAFLDYMSELMQYPVAKLYTTDGRKVPNLQALILCSGAVVAAGREPFKPSNYDSLGYSRPAKLLGIANRVYPKANAKSESENSNSRSQIFSISSDKGSSNDNNSNDNNSDSSCVPGSHNGIVENHLVTGQDLSVAQYEDDIEKSVHVNQDGSITVEMKVRLKIKEEETIKWTTTVSRAGLSDGKNATICSSEMCASNENVPECIKPRETPVLKSYKEEEGDSLQQFNSEVSDKDSEADLNTAVCTKDSSADLDASSVAEDNSKPRFYRPPTPGPRRLRQKKAVVESVTLVSEQEVQEKTVGQFSYSEEIQNGENKSEYCMVAHSSRKKSSVINPKYSETSDNDLLKLSSDNIKEEMHFKVSHRSSDLIETTNRKTVEVPDEDELVENIVEKSVVEQGTYSSLVSTCKANIRGFIPSSKTCQAARPVSADCIQASYSEHSACSGHSQMKMMVSPCSEAPTERNPTTGFSPALTESKDLVSVSTESVMTTHLIDDSHPAPSLTKKKKKRKSPNLHEQGTCENQKGKDLSGTIESEGMHTSETTQDSAKAAMDNSSEMPQKEGTELLVTNNNRSVSSGKRICPDDEFYHQDSVEQNGLSSNKNTSSTNKKSAKVKSKSGKKKSIGSSAKSEDGLMMVDSHNESQHSQDTLSTGKPDTRLTNSSLEQTSNSAVISKPLSEVPKNLYSEKENNTLEKLSLRKEKKQKRMNKNISKNAEKLKMPERAITLEALKQKDFQNDLVEHSLENYVQTWLKNVLPNSVLPPIKRREGNVENSSDCNVPKDDTDASIEKEIKFITNKVHRVEHNLTKKKLKPICELGTLEVAAKDSGEEQSDSLIHAKSTVVGEAKYTLKSESHHSGQLQLFHETQDNEKKRSEADIQDTNLCQIKKSEVAVQVDYTIVNEKMGIDVQNNCVSSILLHELQSALLGLQKDHNGCKGKACSLSDLSPAAFGCSSNVLLAWLLVLNLRENLIGTVKDDLQKTTCSCSEIFTQLQFLKQSSVTDKVDELKASFSHLQQSTENNLLHFGRELKNQDCTHCCENIPQTEIPNDVYLRENEKSEELCLMKDSA
ncbi:RP1 protein, partial [Tricholaema leucomelas]|nr:RP1 protein [Tricholaema leucomelas]